MCYIRGHARDYDIWRQLGNVGWSWDDVLPYFKNIEKYPRGANAAHGTDGELGVQENRVRWEIVEAWKRAAIDYGIPETDDHNAGDNDGVAYFQGTIRNGRRSSAAQAFLHPVMDRPNLRVLTQAHAKQLRLEGKRAVGVEFWQGDKLSYAAGDRRSHPCRRRDRLAADSWNCPASARPTCCGKHGIAVKHELPGVGENMQDHWQIRQTFKVKNTITMNQWVAQSAAALQHGRVLSAHQARPDGHAAAAAMRVHAQRSVAGHAEPAVPRLGGDAPTASAGRCIRMPGFSCGIAVVRPQSIGYCHIKSADPHAHPAILHNFLREPEAQRVAVDAIRLTRKIVSRPGARALRAGGNRAGRQGAIRRRNSRLCAPDRDHRVPPVRHLQDGAGPDGGGRRAAARARA